MVTQIIYTDYAAFKVNNGLLGLTKKTYYADDSAANKFICIVLEPDSQVQFIFKVTTANKPATFVADFSTAQLVSDIII